MGRKGEGRRRAAGEQGRAADADRSGGPGEKGERDESRNGDEEEESIDRLEVRREARTKDQPKARKERARRRGGPGRERARAAARAVPDGGGVDHQKGLSSRSKQSLRTYEAADN
eukprot:889012-Pleurochrysis_carterae.AAC.1